MDEIKKGAAKVIGEMVFNHATKKIMEEIPQGIANALYKVNDIQDNDNIEETKRETREGTIVDTKDPTSGEMKEEISEEMAKFLIELNKKGSEVAREERKELKEKLEKELMEMKMKWREMKKINKFVNAIKNEPEGALAEMWLELNKLKDELEKETNELTKWFLNKKVLTISHEINRLLKTTKKKTEKTTEDMAIESREKKLMKTVKNNEEYKRMMERELELIGLEMGKINELVNRVKNEPELSKVWLTLIGFKDEMENETDMVKKMMIRKKVKPMLDEISRMLKETRKKRNLTDKGSRINTVENTKAVAKNKTKKEIAEAMARLLRKMTNKEQEIAKAKKSKSRTRLKKEMEEMRLKLRELQMMDRMTIETKNVPNKKLSKMWPILRQIRKEIKSKTDEETKKRLRKEESEMWATIQADFFTTGENLIC